MTDTRAAILAGKLFGEPRLVRLVLAILFLIPSPAALAQNADQHVEAENRRCLNCHAQPSIGQLPLDELAFMVRSNE